MIKKKKNPIERLLTSRYMKPTFLGTQLSRLKMGMSYATLVLSAISALSLLKMAFPFVENNEWLLILLIPVIFGGVLLIGYLLDKHNINSMDSLKSSEMVHRFLNTGDQKNQEFQLLQTQILLEAMQAMQNDEKIDLESIQNKYDDYRKKWKKPI
ncbi:MAG: hypothetical protein GY870_04745 [archaeon]|nr:hypothetical protein [archaeon]